MIRNLLIGGAIWLSSGLFVCVCWAVIRWRDKRNPDGFLSPWSEP